MLSYFARRFAQAIPILILSSVLVFMIIHLLPGDPALALVGADADDATITAVRQKFGLDQPLWVQYAIWLSRVVQGDLGTSLISGLPVSTLIARAFPATIELALVTFVAVILLAVPLGVNAAMNEDGPFDSITSGTASFLLGTPNFWLAILLILGFSVSLNWFPPSGRVPLLENPGVGFRFLFLPVLALTPRLAAVILLFVRAATLEVLNEDYVRTARAKGLAGGVIAFKHVLRNAMLPIMTVLSVQFARLLGGAVVIEVVFAWPGMGRLLVNAVENLDYPVIQAVLLILVFVFILINVLTDVLYGIADPRIRLGN